MANEDRAVFSLQGLVVRPGGCEPAEATVPVERALVIQVNGQPVATLMSLPGLERELAVGFCLSEGLVASWNDVLLVQYCRDEEGLPAEEGGGAVVRLRVRPEGLRGQDRGMRWVLSGCGGVEVNLEGLELAPLPAEGAAWLSPEALWSMAGHLRGLEGMYQRTGAVHGAGLFSAEGTPLVLAEDIGRHNAIDKVLGTAAIHGLLSSNLILLTTGRASHEMVAKALRLQVPVVGSFSAATSLAIELAERGACTLLGRLRRQSFLIYTHPWRIRCVSAD